MFWSQADFRSQPEVDTAGGLRSDGSLIHICNVRRGPQHSPGRFRLAIYKRSESAFLVLGTLAGFIQLLDAVVGLLQHDPGKAIGPLVIAAFQLFAVLPVE
jgi:hypothetical protein